MDQEPIFQTAVQASTASFKWSGAAGAVWWGVFSFNEWMALLGFVVAVIGTYYNSKVNKYYKQREDARAQERHDALTAEWKQ